MSPTAYKERIMGSCLSNFKIVEIDTFYITIIYVISVRFRLDFYCVPGTQGINKS